MEKLTKVRIRFWEDDPDNNLDADPDAGGDKDKDEQTYTKADMEKAVARRQAALARARKAEESEKELKEKMKGMPDPDEFDTLQKELDAAKNAIKEMKETREQEELEKIEDEKARERKKAERELAKEKDKFQQQLDALQEQIANFEDEKKKHSRKLDTLRRKGLESEILGAASGKAYNPQQVLRLTVEEFVYDEEDDRWFKEVFNSNGSLKELLSVDEYITAFLADEKNENLLKVKVKDGSGTRRGANNRADDGGAGKETPSDEMFKWAAHTGLNITKDSPADKQAWLHRTYTRMHTKGYKKAE